jgi:hypothetical protein
MSVARRCLELASLFEAELLTELMLRYWKYPLADAPDFRSDLLEAATQALQYAVYGGRLFDSLSPRIRTWLSRSGMPSGQRCVLAQRRIRARFTKQRERWLENVKRAIPSCFMDDILTAKRPSQHPVGD